MSHGVWWAVNSLHKSWQNHGLPETEVPTQVVKAVGVGGMGRSPSLAPPAAGCPLTGLHLARGCGQGALRSRACGLVGGWKSLPPAFGKVHRAGSAQPSVSHGLRNGGAFPPSSVAGGISLVKVQLWVTVPALILPSPFPKPWSLTPERDSPAGEQPLCPALARGASPQSLATPHPMLPL